MKTVSNGGLVTSSSGYDIIVTTDQGLGTMIPWEVEYWTGTDGLWIGWALLSTVNGSAAGSNTTFGFGIGNSGVTTQQNTGANGPTNVWNSHYKAVYHLANPGSSTSCSSGSPCSVVDSTANAVTVFNTGGTNPASCIIDGCAGFFASKGLTASSPPFPTGTAQRTLELIFKLNLVGSFPADMAGWGDNSNNFGRWALFYPDASHLGLEVRNSGIGIAWTADATNWHYLVATLPSGATNTNGVLIYLDGTNRSTTGGTSNTLITSNSQVVIGAIPGASTADPFRGEIEEVRVSDIALTADWIFSQNNNVFSPGNIGNPGFLIWTNKIRHSAKTN